MNLEFDSQRAQPNDTDNHLEDTDNEFDDEEWQEKSFKTPYTHNFDMQAVQNVVNNSPELSRAPRLEEAMAMLSHGSPEFSLVNLKGIMLSIITRYANEGEEDGITHRTLAQYCCSIMRVVSFEWLS